MNDPSDSAASSAIAAGSASATLTTSAVSTHPRTLEYTESVLPGLIPDESELTARVKIEPGKRYGFFTDTSLCIGCKAQVACKEWYLLPADDLSLSGMSCDNTRRLFATTWRHVTFVEKILESSGKRATQMSPFQSNGHFDDGGAGGGCRVELCARPEEVKNARGGWATNVAHPPLANYSPSHVRQMVQHLLHGQRQLRMRVFQLHHGCLQSAAQ